MTTKPPPVPKLPKRRNDVLVATERANGDADKPSGGRRRFYFYLFVASPKIDDPRLASVAEALAGSHPNIGDLWLKIGAKLIGIREVESFALQWCAEDNRLRLVVTRDGKAWVCLGTAAPE